MRSDHYRNVVVTGRGGDCAPACTIASRNAQFMARTRKRCLSVCRFWNERGKNRPPRSFALYFSLKNQLGFCRGILNVSNNQRLKRLLSPFSLECIFITPALWTQLLVKREAKIVKVFFIGSKSKFNCEAPIQKPDQSVPKYEYRFFHSTHIASLHQGKCAQRTFLTHVPVIQQAGSHSKSAFDTQTHTFQYQFQ